MERSTPERIDKLRSPLRYVFSTPVSSMRIRLLLPMLLALAMVGCDAPAPRQDVVSEASPSSSIEESEEPDQSDLVRPADSEGSTEVPESDARSPVRIVFLGTSLTEGLGLEAPAVEAWPQRVGVLADSAGIRVRVLNSGLGGETSAGALRRLSWVMQQDPDVLVVETGANDGLRGLPVDQLESNLEEIVREARASKDEVIVVLARMEAPPNMGEDYQNAFREAFPRVAARLGTELIPFLLDGVAGEPELNQGDGKHPTAEGHWIMARNAWPVLEEAVQRAATR